MANLQDLTINDTGYLKIESNSAHLRPASPSTGEIRFNTTYNQLEFYDGDRWTRTDREVIILNGMTDQGAFDDLDQINNIHTGTVTLKTTFYNQFYSTPGTVTVDASTSATPKYQTTSNTGSDNQGSGVNGTIVNVDGTVGSCSQGVTSSFTMYGAMRACILAGGRLCTKAEIEAGAASGTGCSHDYRGIWTSTPSGDGDGRYWIVMGGWYNPSYQYRATALPNDMNDVITKIAGFGAAFLGVDEIGIRCCFPQSGNDSWDLRG